LLTAQTPIDLALQREKREKKKASRGEKDHGPPKRETNHAFHPSRLFQRGGLETSCVLKKMKGGRGRRKKNCKRTETGGKNKKRGSDCSPRSISQHVLPSRVVKEGEGGDGSRPAGKRGGKEKGGLALSLASRPPLAREKNAK